MRRHTNVEGVLALDSLNAGASQNVDIAVVVAQHILTLRIHRGINIEVLQGQIGIVLNAHRTAGDLQCTVLQGDGCALFKVHGLALVAGAADSLSVHCIGMAAKVEGQLPGILGFDLNTASLCIFQQGDSITVRGCCSGFRQ